MQSANALDATYTCHRRSQYASGARENIPFILINWRAKKKQ